MLVVLFIISFFCLVSKTKFKDENEAEGPRSPFSIDFRK